ncbi:MAG: FAD-dependent oxidoreductase, partial [Thiohalomonadaceae bacterium]
MAIAGGGLAGLACAAGLWGCGVRITLLEATPWLGGRARSWVDEATGDAIDLGSHVLTSEHRNMLALLRMLGTERDVVWKSGNFLVLADRPPLVMKRYPLPAPLSLLPSLFTVRRLRLRDLSSNTPVVMLAMRMNEDDVVRLDDESAADLLTRMGVTPAFIAWFWKSAAMTFMNVPLEECSAGALLRVFKQLLGDNAFRFGFPARGLGELFVPAAARRIEEEGGRIVMPCPVRSVVYERGRAAGFRLADGSVLHARYCVCALTPQDLLPVLPDLPVLAGLRRDLPAFRPVPYVSTWLWFDRRLTREQMWVRLWSADGLSYDSYDLSNIRPALRGRPALIAGNIINSARALTMSDEAIVQATVQEIAEYIPGVRHARLVHAHVNRILMAITAPRPGMERKRPGARTALPGLFLAGDWTATRFPSSMESAVRSGWTAAEQIRAELGMPRRLVLPMT